MDSEGMDQVFGNRYRVEEQVGSGGMAIDRFVPGDDRDYDSIRRPQARLARESTGTGGPASPSIPH